MPRHRRAMASGEEAETVMEPGCHALYPEGRGACRRELDCQRDAIETTTDSSNRRQSAFVGREIWRRRSCPLHEQPNRAVAQRILATRTAFARYREGLHRIDLLPLSP